MSLPENSKTLAAARGDAPSGRTFNAQELSQAKAIWQTWIRNHVPNGTNWKDANPPANIVKAYETAFGDSVRSDASGDVNLMAALDNMTNQMNALGKSVAALGVRSASRGDAENWSAVATKTEESTFVVTAPDGHTYKVINGGTKEKAIDKAKNMHREWARSASRGDAVKYQVGDNVAVTTTGQTGVVTKIVTGGVMVKHPNGSELHYSKDRVVRTDDNGSRGDA